MRPAHSFQMYFVYIIKSEKDSRTYTGYTSNIDKRLKMHNTGYNRSTKSRRPFTLLHSESFETMSLAKERELWWKSSSGRKKMKELFK